MPLFFLFYPVFVCPKIKIIHSLFNFILDKFGDGFALTPNENIFDLVLKFVFLLTWQISLDFVTLEPQTFFSKTKPISMCPLFVILKSTNRSTFSLSHVFD